MKVLEARQLAFSYGQVPVLSHVTFALRQGGFAALIGSNGAGKSTLIKLLLGELSPTAGTVRLLGLDADKGKVRNKIGYVPQDGLVRHAAFPASVMEIVLANLCAEIGLFRFPGQKHRQRVRQALESVGMGGYEKRMIGELSGGQRQRVLLARALVARPEVMILDEPTTGMDQQSADSFYRLLAHLHNSAGLSILMASHDVQRICSYVSTVYCLEHGTMVELTPAQVQAEQQARHHHPQPGAEGGSAFDHF